MKSKWVIKKIGDLCDEVIKKAPREIYREKFTYIDISSVDPVQKKIVNPKLLTVDLAPGRARKIVTTGDVIFATTRPYLENIAKIKAEITNPVASTGFCVMSPKSELLDSDYLFHYVTSPDFINRVVAKQKGAAYPAVSDSDVFNMEIPLPSLEVQKKIVKVLEEKLGKVKEAIKIREEAIADTNKILSTRLTEIFEDGKKQGWEEKRLDDKSTLLMTSGGTPSRSNKNFYQGDIAWLKSGELNDNLNIVSSEEHISDEAVKKSSAKVFPAGAVLFAMYGATAGKLGILGIPAATNQAVAALIPIEGKLLNVYLYYFLMMKREQIISKAWGGAQPNLSQTIIKTFSVPVPDFETQQKVVKELDELSLKVSELRKLQESQLSDLKNLEQAYLREAFSGDLI